MFNKNIQELPERISEYKNIEVSDKCEMSIESRYTHTNNIKYIKSCVVTFYFNCNNVFKAKFLFDEILSVNKDYDNLLSYSFQYPYIQLVYQAPYKEDIHKILDISAFIRSSIIMLFKKENLNLNNFSIGIDYGETHIFDIPEDSNYFKSPVFLCVGDVLYNSKKLCFLQDNRINISDIIWKNLTDEYKSLFKKNGDYYYGDIVNKSIDNIINQK